MKGQQLDKIDKQILRLLQKNAELSSNEIAEQVCLSPSPCARRIRNLYQSGVIKNKVALLDPLELGLAVTAFIQVTLKRQASEQLQSFEDVLENMPEVMDCYLVAGEYDYLLKVLVKDLNAYKDFLENKLTPLNFIDHIKTSFSLKVLRSKTELPLEHLNQQKRNY
ncbi:Lrp/AsnC family transcriptional regulator [Paraferrimonas sp. SM1919]|uniref:Lrp/AsnC family transcriptional regulator n=1 Tax=Paraferrimonas sp. SM1919 TaxID=2662263 RepID=UPI0013D30C91|nr:Lrp/AsnC family transcriptional regulator [Paraferrimonas sp. SM1919]